MELKEFEKFLEIEKFKKENAKEFYDNYEMWTQWKNLGYKLEELLYNNQNARERLVTKLKNSLVGYYNID